MNGKMIACQGEVHSISEWARITGIRQATLWSRLNNLGWTPERALTTPAGRRRKGLPREAAPVPAREPKPRVKSLKGLDLDTVAAMARESGMTYGKFVQQWRV